MQGESNSVVKQTSNDATSTFSLTNVTTTTTTITNDSIIHGTITSSSSSDCLALEHLLFPTSSSGGGGGGAIRGSIDDGLGGGTDESAGGGSVSGGGSSSPFLMHMDPSCYYQEYLAELTSFSLNKLRSEPKRLEQERFANRIEIESLAFNNYNTFIKGAECIKSIRGQVLSLATHTSSLQAQLPVLSQACHTFTEVTTEIAKKRKKNYITLQQHTGVLELLELPQLMDTCVKNKFYEEALELEQFARKLFQQNPQISIIRDIMRDVEISSEVMTAQLHQQLSSQCRLQDSIRIVNYLKRIAIYNDREIRIVFLQSRDQYMTYIISLVPSGNSFMNISKMIDTYRTEMLDIINQYNTIFSHSTDEYSSILYSWSHHKIREFLTRLNSNLDNIKDGSFLTNMLNSCMFFAKNLGRVGMDFRALLPPIFEKCIINLFDRNMARAVSQLSTHLRKYKNLSAHKGLSAYNPTNESDYLPAPRILLDFPPLAILTNTILEAFNELRNCWPYSLKRPLVQHFTESLYRILEKLREHKNQTPMNDTELSVFGEMCQVVSEEFLPYVTKCFEAIFQGSQQQPVVSSSSSSHRLFNLDTLQNKISDMYEQKFSQQTLSEILQKSKQTTTTVETTPSTTTSEDSSTTTTTATNTSTTTMLVEDTSAYLSATEAGSGVIKTSQTQTVM